MPTITAGASAIVTVPLGYVMDISSTNARVTLGAGPQQGNIYPISGDEQIGPFSLAQVAEITAYVETTYTLRDPAAVVTPGGSSDGSTTFEDVTTTAYTLTDADATGKTLRATNVAGCEFMYPSGLAWEPGQRVEILDVSGLSTFVDDGTSVLTSLADQYTSAGAGAKVVIECTGANTAKLYGEYGLSYVSFTVPFPQDPDTALTPGTSKCVFRMPFAMTGVTFRASLKTASSSGNPTFDINENGVSVLGTKLSIDANEKTSVTATTPAVVSDSSLADDAEMTCDIDVAGTGATGAAITVYGWTAA